MKIISVIARWLLGLLFAVAGLNGLVPFTHQPLPTNPIAAQFLVAANVSHFSASFFAVQLLAGLLLLSGFYVPIALILLAAELYNILAFHITLEPGAGPGLVACVLWVMVFLQYRESFERIFEAKPRTSSGRFPTAAL